MDQTLHVMRGIQKWFRKRLHKPIVAAYQRHEIATSSFRVLQPILDEGRVMMPYNRIFVVFQHLLHDFVSFEFPGAFPCIDREGLPQSSVNHDPFGGLIKGLKITRGTGKPISTMCHQVSPTFLLRGYCHMIMVRQRI